MLNTLIDINIVKPVKLNFSIFFCTPIPVSKNQFDGHLTIQLWQTLPQDYAVERFVARYDLITGEYF